MTYVHIKRYKRHVRNAAGVKRHCSNCDAWATVTATRLLHGKTMPVRFCDSHAQRALGI